MTARSAAAPAPGTDRSPPPGSRTVTTDDGIPLHVEIDGDLDRPLAVVLSHRFTARLAAWELQRAVLALEVLGRVPVTVVAAPTPRLARRRTGGTSPR